MVNQMLEHTKHYSKTILLIIDTLGADDLILKVWMHQFTGHLLVPYGQQYNLQQTAQYWQQSKE